MLRNIQLFFSYFDCTILVIKIFNTFWRSKLTPSSDETHILLFDIVACNCNHFSWQKLYFFMLQYQSFFALKVLPPARLCKQKVEKEARSGTTNYIAIKHYGSIFLMGTCPVLCLQYNRLERFGPCFCQYLTFFF